MDTFTTTEGVNETVGKNVTVKSANVEDVIELVRGSDASKYGSECFISIRFLVFDGNGMFT